MQGGLKPPRLLALGLALLAASGLALLAFRVGFMAERSAAAPAEGPVPLAAPAPSASALSRPPSSPASSPAARASRNETRVAGEDILSRPALDWYKAALRPTATVRDRTIALQISVLCAQVSSARDAYEEMREVSRRPPVASAPGVSAQELAELNLLNANAAPAEQAVELQKLGDYCSPSHDFPLLTELRKSRVRPTEYAELVLVHRPLAGRLPVVVGVLGNPKANAAEFVIWAEHGLRDVFVQRHGLSYRQAWHASGWLIREVLGNAEELALYYQIQCAVYAYCRSASLLSDADRQRAEAAARQVLQDLQRQDWPRLIYSTQQ